MSFFLFSSELMFILLSLLVLVLVFIYDSRTLSYYVCLVIRFLGGKQISRFHISSISLWKLSISDFEVKILSSANMPEANVSFKSLEIVVHSSRIVRAILGSFMFWQSRNLSTAAAAEQMPWFSMVIVDLSMGSNRIFLRDFMMPSSNSKGGKPYAVPKQRFTLASAMYFIARNVARLIEIEMKDFSFDFRMPDEDITMQGSAENIIVRFQYSKAVPTESILISVVLRDGIQEIFEHEERALLYAGHIVRFLVDYHLPTGMMDVMANLYGEEHDMEVCIPRFMAFFNKFNDADDYTAGIKISRGMEPNGKMSMCGEIDLMKVGITDPRVPGQQLIMRIEKTRASLSTFKMTVDKRRTHKGRLCVAEPNPCNRIIGSETFLPPLQNADFTLSKNAEKEMTAVCGKVLFQLSSLSNQFYVENAEFFKVVSIWNERDFIDGDSTKISLQLLNMFGLDQNMIDWLMVLQDTSNRLPNSVHSHPRNVKMEFHGRTMQFSMCPLSFATDLSVVRKLHNDHRRTLLPVLPLDDERLLAFVFTDVNIVKTASAKSSNVSHYNADISLLEVRTCVPLTDFQAQHQIVLLDAIDSNECSIAASRRASFKESIEQSRSVPHKHHLRGHMDQTFSSFDCRNWKRPGTGVSWKFTSMQFTVEMGARVIPKQMQIKKISLDMINTCRLQVGQSSAAYNSTPGKESQSSRKSSSTKKSSETKPSKMSGKQKPPTLETSQHEFYSVVGVSVVWASLTDIKVTMKSMNMQASVAGGLKFLCAYNMTKNTVDAMVMRLECVRIVGDHLIDHLPLVRMKEPEEEDPKLEVRIEDFTMMVSASIDAIPITSMDSVSQKSGNGSDFANNTSQYNPRGAYGGITGLSGQETGRCLIMKFRNLVHGTSRCNIRYHFDQCEMSLSHHPSKPFVSIDVFDYRIKKRNFVQKSSDEAKKIRRKDKFKGYHNGTPLLTTSDLYMKTFILQMHSAMDVGLIVESLLQQDALYKAAVTPKADRKNPYIIYDSMDINDLQPGPSITPFPLTRSVATNIPHFDMIPSGSIDEQDSHYGFLDIAHSEDNAGYIDYQLDDAIEHINPMTNRPFGSKPSPLPSNSSIGSNLSHLNLNDPDHFEKSSTVKLQNTDSTEVERTIFTVAIDSYIVKVEVPLPSSIQRRMRQSEEECIMTVSLNMLRHKVEQLKDTDSVQDDILKLDIGEEALLDDSLLSQFYMYQQIQGGSINFQAKSMQILLSCQPDPVLDVAKPSMSGLFYMASLKDDRIPVEYQIAQLLDTMRIAVGVNESFLDDEDSVNNAQRMPKLLAITENVVPIYGVLTKSLAPTKIFADVDLTAVSYDIKIHQCSTEVLNHISPAFERCLPPNHDISPPMAWWDSLRYWMHGSMSMHFGKMSFAYVIPNVSVETMTIMYSLVAPTWHVDSKAFEFTTRDVEAWVELVSQLSQASGMGTRKTNRARGSSQQFRKGSDTTTTSGKKKSKISRVGHIPGFIMALRYSAATSKITGTGSERNSMRSPIPTKANTPRKTPGGSIALSDEYNHHHVYLKPTIIKRVEENAEEVTILGKVRYLYDGEYYDDLQYQDNDRFVSFRAKPNSIKWDLEVRFANRDKEIISCNLRLDILLRVYVALFQPGGQSGHVLSPEGSASGSVNHASSKSIGQQTNNNRPFALNESQSPLSYPSEAADEESTQPPKEPMPLMAMVAQLDLQMIVDELMLSSLLSDSNMKGIVLKHQIMDVQLRLTRKGLDGEDTDFSDQVESFLEKHPLLVEHLFMEMYMYEIYVDTWCRLFPDVTRNPPMTRVPFDDPSYRRNSEQFQQQIGPIEPSEPAHFSSMMKPICKFGHASRIVVSLTESGEVSNRSTTFKSTGILNPAEITVDVDADLGLMSSSAKAKNRNMGNRRSSTGRASMFIIGKEWRRRTCGTTDVSATMLNRIHEMRHSNHAMPDASTALRSALKPSGVSSRAKSDFGRSPPIKAGRTSNGVTFRDMPARRISILDPSKRAQHSMKLSSNTPPTVHVPVPKWNPQWGYRASLRSFAANHSAFTPPEQALPTSYLGPRTRVAGTASLRLHPQPVGAGNTATYSPDNQSSFGTKIWGLRVIDGRILLTIDMRDVLFEYVTRTMEIFMNSEEEEISEEKAAQQAKKNAQRTPQNKEKASLSDFILLDDTSPIPLNPSASLMLSSNYNLPLDHYQTGTSSPGGGGNRNRIYSFGSVEENSTAWETTSMSRLYLRQRSVENNSNDYEVSPMGGATLYSPVMAPTGSFIAESTAQDGLQRQSSAESMRQMFQQQAAAAKRSKASRRGSLFNRSIEMPDHHPFTHQSSTTVTNDAAEPELLLPPLDSMASPPGRNRSSTNAAANAAASSSKPSSPQPKREKKSRKPVNEYFFVVEFIDPQVNFLDPETHSSVIIVAGRAIVEGQRSNTAILPLATTYNGGDDNGDNGGSNVAKRRRELRLKMDGVSAYTVPSMLNENNDAEDEVHWKVMQSTADKMELKNLPRGGEEAQNGSLPANGSNPAFHPAQSHGPSHVNPRLLVAMHGIEQQESPFMKVAIRDFQIRALYIFWTDVTSEEARELYVQHRDEDMTYTFRLELPDLVVDITSWQFYIILHVVKNVFLVPPPTQVSKRKQDEAEEAEGSKFVMVPRDAAVLAKYNFRSTGGALDINNQRSREELRILLEEFMNNQHQQQHYGDGTGATARFMEVFIGRMSWILRTTGLTPTSGNNSNMNSAFAAFSAGSNGSDHELIEAGFVGIYASINFHENRSLNSSFEIQRFWMVNRNPGDDTSLFEDRTCVMVPVLKEREVCTRCNREFDLDHNPSTACIFHADDDGNPGQYCEIIYRDELSGQELKQMGWTCCHKHQKEASGCSARPHMGKEVMVSIRLDVDPRARFGDDVDVSVIKGMEISIFPGASYDLRLQVTKSLADVLHRYFSIDASAENIEAIAQQQQQQQQSAHGSSLNGNSHKDNNMTMSTHGPNNTSTMNMMAPAAVSNKKKGSKLLSSLNIFKRSKKDSASTSSQSGSTADLSSDSLSTSHNNGPSHRDSTSSQADLAGLFPQQYPSNTVRGRAGSAVSVASTHGGTVSFANNVNNNNINSNNTNSATKRLYRGLSSKYLRPRGNSLASMTGGEEGAHLTSAEQQWENEASANHNGRAGRNRNSSRYSSDGDHLLLNGNSQHGHAGAGGMATTTIVAKKPKKKRQEALYLRRLRVGEIYVDVSTAGFTLNLDRFKAEMEPFICRGEVLDWRRLIWNFERHLVWSLTKHTASNSLSRLGEFFAGKRKNPPSSIATATTTSTANGIGSNHNGQLLLGIVNPHAPLSSNNHSTNHHTVNDGSASPTSSSNNHNHHNNSNNHTALPMMHNSTTTGIDISGRSNAHNHSSHANANANSSSGGNNSSATASPQLTAQELARQQQERLKTAMLLGIAQPHPRHRLHGLFNSPTASQTGANTYNGATYHTPNHPHTAAAAGSGNVAQSSSSSVNSDLTTSDDRDGRRSNATPVRKRLFGIF